MGMMRFRVAPTQRITAHLARQAYLAGADRTPWTAKASIEGDEIVLQRSVSDSANLYIPWPVEGYGPMMLATGSLMEQPDPYWLPLELARGAIVQLRNQLSEWQIIGLAVPAAVHAKLATAVEDFSWAVVGQEDAAARAEQSLVAALTASDILIAAYADQVLALRRRSGNAQSLLLGADLSNELLTHHASRQFSTAFNAAEVPLAWSDVEASEGDFSWETSDRQIEWCRASGLKVLAGPLFLLDPRALPDWLYLFENDVDSIVACASAFVRAVVERYRGRVDYWICAGRVNTSETLSLSEQERLRLVARMIELVRAWDPDTPVLASFDQPWAEYMRERHSDFPPLHFADALVRAGADLEGLMLEINVGDCPGGTMPRNPLDFNRQFDAWTRLGLPLWISLSAPGGEGTDELASRKPPLGSEVWTPAAQQMFATRLVPFALAKPAVRGVIWNQLSDARTHDFPHAGLFDARRRPKPTLRTLSAIRRKYLS